MKITKFLNLSEYNFYADSISLTDTSGTDIPKVCCDESQKGFLMLCISGTASCTYKSTALSLNPDTLFYMPPATVCSIEYSTDFQAIYIFFKLIDTTDNEEIVFSKAPEIIHSKAPSQICAAISEFSVVYSSENSSHIIKYRSMLFNLLYLLCTATEITGEKKSYFPLNSAIAYLHNNYQLDFSTKDLADMCNLSEPYFRSIFKKKTGVTPTEYKNRLRIKKACTLLTDTHLTISEISDMTGFNSVQYFCETFKNTTGTAPMLYRNLSAT